MTRALDQGLSYRQVQMMSGHQDPKTVMRYVQQSSLPRSRRTIFSATRARKPPEFDVLRVGGSSTIQL